MRNYFFWISVLLLFSTAPACLAQPFMNETERANNLKNKLKLRNAYALKLNRGIDKRTLLEERTYYDPSGNIANLVLYDSTDLEMLRWTSLYDTHNRLTSRFFCIYRDTVAKTRVIYTDKGFPTEEITENTDGVVLCRFVYTCDPQGRILRSKEEIFPEIKDFVRQAYRYDQQGFLVLRYLGESKSHVSLNFKYEYTRSGLLSRVTEIGQDTIPFGWITYDYNKDGTLRSFSVKHENGKHFKIFYTYDAHGALKSESKNLYLNTVLLDQQKDEYTLDAKGITRKRLRYRMNNELYMLYNYTYEFYE